MTRTRPGYVVAAVLGAIAVIIAVTMFDREDHRGLAARLVDDCRERVRAETGLRSLEWRPGRNRVAVNADLTHHVEADARTREADGRPIGIAAQCSYTVAPDSSFDHQGMSVRQVTLSPQDSTQ